MKKRSIFFLYFTFIITIVNAQQLLEGGIIYGGITGGGFSTNTGSGTVTTNVAIPPNSTIKKAYLFRINGFSNACKVNISRCHLEILIKVSICNTWEK